MASAITAQPKPQQKTADESSFPSFVQAISKIDAATRLKIAQQLKKAGLYRGKPTDKFNNDLLDALRAAEERRANLAAFTEVPPRLDFIQNLAAEAEVAGGAGGPSKTISTVEDVSLRAMAIAVLEAQTGDQGTEAEINNLIERAKKKQAKNPRVTTYTTSGGVTKSETTGGVDVGQFMIDIVSKTDEARANKVLQAYNIAVNTLGGLR